MTKQEFIDNFNINKKLENIKELRKMSFKDWLKIKEQSIIEKKSLQLALVYNEFETLINKKETNKLNHNEINRYNFLYNLFYDDYENRIAPLEKEIANFYRDLEYFCEIPNLSFEEWLNSYYIENLVRIPEEEFPLKYKKERLLRVDVFNGKLDEEKYYKIMKHDPIEAYQSKIYIKSDYVTYLKTQVTRPIIEMEYLHK